MKNYEKKIKSTINANVKGIAHATVKEAVKEKTPMDKLYYWAIFKITYHVTFVYHFVKGLILRRW